jgi:hypothetical protein
LHISTKEINDYERKIKNMFDDIEKNYKFIQIEMKNENNLKLLYLSLTDKDINKFKQLIAVDFKSKTGIDINYCKNVMVPFSYKETFDIWFKE